MNIKTIPTLTLTPTLPEPDLSVVGVGVGAGEVKSVAGIFCGGRMLAGGGAALGIGCLTAMTRTILSF